MKERNRTIEGYIGLTLSVMIYLLLKGPDICEAVKTIKLSGRHGFSWAFFLPAYRFACIKFFSQ